MKKKELCGYIYNMTKMLRSLNARKLRPTKRYFSVTRLLQKGNLREKADRIHKFSVRCQFDYVFRSVDYRYIDLVDAVRHNNYYKIAHFLDAKYDRYCHNYQFLLNVKDILCVAIVFGNYETNKLILKSKCINVNADLGDRDYALNYIVEQNKLDVAELLLEAGADTEIEDGNGRTPMIIAKSNNNLPMVDLLLGNGASN